MDRDALAPGGDLETDLVGELGRALLGTETPDLLDVEVWEDRYVTPRGYGGQPARRRLLGDATAAWAFSVRQS